MDCKQIKIDGNDVLKDGLSGILYTGKNWRAVATRDQAINNQGYHGRLVSDTYVSKRIITIEGVSDRLGNLQDQIAIDYLHDIFKIRLGVNHEIYIKDMYDQERIMDVKIRETLEILEGDESFRGSHWKRRVVLESMGDPAYFSFIEESVVGIEWMFGGNKLTNKLPNLLNGSFGHIEILTTSNVELLPRFELNFSIDATQGKIKIYNMENKSFFELVTNAVPGDIIIIDSLTRIATKNGININGQIKFGSTRPSINGNTRFGIFDGDATLNNNDIDATVYFRDRLL